MLLQEWCSPMSPKHERMHVPRNHTRMVWPSLAPWRQTRISIQTCRTQVLTLTHQQTATTTWSCPWCSCHGTGGNLLNQTICLLPFSSCDSDTHHWLQTHTQTYTRTHMSDLTDHELTCLNASIQKQQRHIHGWAATFIWKRLEMNLHHKEPVIDSAWTKVSAMDPMQKGVGRELSVCVDSICVWS